MADQTSPIQQLAAGSNAVDRVNENFDAGSPERGSGLLGEPDPELHDHVVEIHLARS